MRAAACEGTARADLRTRGAGLRGAKLRPAAVPCRNCKFKIQNKIGLPDNIWAYSSSGRGLRRARTKRTCGTRVAGLRHPQAAARRCLTASILLATSLCPSSEPAGHEQRASAAGRLRLARPFQGRNSKFKILNSNLAATSNPTASPQPSGGACDRKELPAVGDGGCGLPVAARPITSNPTACIPIAGGGSHADRSALAPAVHLDDTIEIRRMKPQPASGVHAERCRFANSVTRFTNADLASV